jgi:putative isomerase
MDNLTRRSLLAGLALQGASLLCAQSGAAAALKNAAAGGSLPAGTSKVAGASLLAYFSTHAPRLLREPAGELKYPSISPTLPRSTYSSELWDWDTLWTARGLFRIARLTHDSALHAEIVEHARGSLFNFFDHQSVEGRIPMLISISDSDPLGCLKGVRPHKENQAKPVLGQLALLVADECGDAAWFAPCFEKLQKFYASWEADNLSATGLLVWGDDVAIGNDNDPTTFGRPFFSSANLLLNCLYYEDLKAAAELALRLKLTEDHTALSAKAQKLGSAIQLHCWDPRDRFFYTADVQCKDRRAELIPNIRRGMDMSWSSIPIRIQTFTGFLPMWCGLATKQQAAELVKHMLDPDTFHGAYGVRSLSKAESMYSLAASTNPSNWLGPVWIIVNYLSWKGLVEYGYRKEAAALAARTLTMLASDLGHSGSLNEYYHPDSGKPLSHTGFMDWNLLALEMI